MNFERSSGVLLHLTSLPGSYGIGELNEHAYRFVDWLASAGQKYWQVMPLGPTGYGDSPYQSFSAFAGNPYLISLDALVRDGLLTIQDLERARSFSSDRVDFGLQFEWRRDILRSAFECFERVGSAELREAFQRFVTSESSWLEDYALFMAVKDAHNGRPWNEWPRELRTREPGALESWAAKLEREVRLYEFVQFLFFRQWSAFRQYAHSKGVQIIGDIPIFVAMDSADAWANSNQFYFDEAGQPTVVAGVPPDYFSETGQLWGNPLYRWDVMQQDGFQWWIDRFRGSLKLYDLIRIDHFRGFAAYWEIPFPAENAVDGRWVEAPGQALFEAVLQVLGNVPIIAEDLGIITPEVEELRDHFGFPGMAVLHFAFGSPEWNANPFLPQNVEENRIIYTGTHDNDTTRGWWVKASENERRHVHELIPDVTDENIAWKLTELAWASRAVLSVAPIQDLLNLGSEARMNIPGTLGTHNWSWRLQEDALTQDLARSVRTLTEQHGR